MVHHKAPVLLHWCIWHVGTTQDPEDTIYLPCDNVEVTATNGCHPLSHLVTDRRLRLWTYCLQLTTRGPPPCCCCGDLGAASRLEMTVRKTKLHLSSCSGGRPWPTEHWPCICLEEGIYSWRLAAHCGHSNAPAEYAIKEEKEKQRKSTSSRILDKFRQHQDITLNSKAENWKTEQKWNRNDNSYLIK